MPQRFPAGTGFGSIGRRKSVYAGSLSGKSSANAPRPPSAKSTLAQCIETLEGRTLLSTSWFVSVTGSDNNTGSVNSPFRTIQRAANLAVAGDHVEIRAGVYHEDVVPKHSGSAGKQIVFEAYNGEKVTVSGADTVAGWSNYSGSIYSASVPFSLGAGNDQVFVDGQMINEARFPNTTLDVSHPSLGHASSVSISGSTATLHDPSLTQTAGYWKGATMHIAPGQAWISQTGPVTNSGPGWVTFNFVRLDKYELPSAGNAYYITSSFKALDGAGEFYNNGSGTLYVRTPSSDNPSSHDIEAKHRLYAFDVTGQHNITIQGLSIFSATIKSDHGSNNLVVNGINAKYVGQFLPFKDGWSVPTNTGIIIAGPNSLLENSTIAYSAGDGVVVRGANSVIHNNIIHDVDYSATDTAAVNVSATGVTVDHNTIYNAGRDGVKHSAAKTKILYNTIHDLSLQTTEAGATYTVNTNGQGTEIAYNTIYNLRAAGFGSTGLFLDNNSSGYLVHNNVVSNVDNALKLNYVCRNDMIYNNTLSGVDFSVSTNHQGDWNGTKIYNNVVNGRVITTGGGSVYNNSTTSAAGKGAGEFASGATGGAFNPPPVTPPVTPIPDPTPNPTTNRAATSTFQAEKWDAMSGVKSDNYKGLGYANGGDWAEYTNIDFGTGVTSFTAYVAGLKAYVGSIEIRLDSVTGPLAGTLKVTASGAWNKYTKQTTAVSGATGVHSVYLVFRGGKGVANVDSFTFA